MDTHVLNRGFVESHAVPDRARRLVSPLAARGESRDGLLQAVASGEGKGDSPHFPRDFCAWKRGLSPFPVSQTFATDCLRPSGCRTMVTASYHPKSRTQILRKRTGLP